MVAVVVGYRGEALGLRAGNLTFITVTSLVPLVALIFSLLHAFQAKRIDPLLLSFFEEILSPGGRAQSEQVLRTFLSASHSRTAGGLSFVALMVSAGLMLRQLDAALNDIWRVREKRPILGSLAMYVGVLLVGPLLFGLSLLGGQGVKHFLTWLEVPFSAQLYSLSALAAGVSAFVLLYKLAPHAHVAWRSALIGGLAAGLAWEAARHVYGGIAVLFFSANKIYGSLGIAPLFLTWIYIGWYILLSGARLAYAVEHVNFHDEFQDLLEHPRSNELIAARIAEEVTRASLKGLTAPTTKALAASLRLPKQRIRELANLLAAQSLIRVEKGHLYPGRDVSVLTLADISSAVRGTIPLNTKSRPSSTGHFDRLARLFSAVDESTIEKLKTISWSDLAQAPSREAEKQ